MPGARPPTRAAHRDDALAELVNVAFGHAAGPLSELLQAHVTMSVPHVERIKSAEIAAKLADIIGPEELVHMVRQAFRPHFRGESLFVLQATSSSGLAQLFGIPDDEAREKEQKSAIVETANILTGACVGKLSELLETKTTFSPPVLLLFSSSITQLVSTQIQPDLTEAILIRTDLNIETRVIGVLFLLLPEAAVAWLDNALDRMIDELD